MRLQKKIPVTKNTTLNVSASGGSLSFKIIPGVSFNLGLNGLFVNLGVPGSGVSKRIKLTNSKKMPKGQNNP
jgi:hypothetical protein